MNCTSFHFSKEKKKKGYKKKSALSFAIRFPLKKNMISFTVKYLSTRCSKKSHVNFLVEINVREVVKHFV